MQSTVSDARVELWSKEVESRAFLEARGARRLFNSVPDIKSAFGNTQTFVACVDEGLVGGLHLAGSGVLLDVDARRETLRRAGITEFTTHDGCGAFRLANPNESDSDRACREWGSSEADALGVLHRHIEADELDRPFHMHTATVIYYDGTGRFNRIAGLPRGFVVSRKHFDSGADDLALCMRIAFGEHGFGDLFTSRSPLYVITLAHPTDRAFSLDALTREAKKAAAPYGRRVEIDGFKTNWYIQD